MYLGSSTITKSNEFIVEEGKFIEKEIEYVPGLVKIFNELIDNSIDEYVRTKGEYSTKIEVVMDENSFAVKDNGRGIPVTKVVTPEGEIYQPELAWTHARAGSNFEDDESTTIGTNGVGSMIASVFSKEFTGVSNDGKNKCTVICKDNNTSINTKITKPTGPQGVQVSIIPDVERFGLEKITQPHIEMIKQRLYNLSVSYPEITFKFNKERIKLNAKKFINMFGEEGTIQEEDNFSIGVFHSDSDDFKHFSLMNGLTLKSGGTHVDFISNVITKNIREKIAKKYKTIKPADVKRKLFIVTILKNFKGPKYETQTKEKLTNPLRDITNHFNGFDFNKFSDKVYKNKTITDSIIDYFRIAEEYKKKQELGKLDKTKKKIKSEKYIKAVGENNMLVICEGASAYGGLSPILGREGIAYYQLKGKPMNTMTASSSKFLANKELSELYTIIKQEGFKKIVIGADNDLDGIAIGGLTSLFCFTYLKEVLTNGMLYILRTPIAVSTSKRNISDWVYNFQEIQNLKGEVSYKKGLGSWKVKDLKYIIEQDGLEKMLEPLTYEEEDSLAFEDWYKDTNTNKRKEFIMKNDFDLIKI
jgi:DNA gyrase/topoisomerase IV subunit B